MSPIVDASFIPIGKAQEVKVVLGCQLERSLSKVDPSDIDFVYLICSNPHVCIGIHQLPAKKKVFLLGIPWGSILSGKSGLVTNSINYSVGLSQFTIKENCKRSVFYELVARPGEPSEQTLFNKRSFHETLHVPRSILLDQGIQSIPHFGVGIPNSLTEQFVFFPDSLLALSGAVGGSHATCALLFSKFPRKPDK